MKLASSVAAETHRFVSWLAVDCAKPKYSVDVTSVDGPDLRIPDGSA
jgi:hypothetical protein